MATPPSRSTLPPAAPEWLQTLSQHRKEMAYVLLGISAAAVVALAVLAWKDSQGNMPFWLWCGGVAVIALGAGLFQLLREPGQLAETDVTRLVVLVGGGLTGLITTAALGLGLTVKWWSTITGGWATWQGPEGPRIWWTLLALVGGLAIMFVSLQLGKADERTNPLLRRLLYGYNAVLSGLLLLAILVIVNLLTYVPWQDFTGPWKFLSYLAFINREHDWSRGSLYSLSEKSENLLQKLDRPVRVSVILETRDPYYHPVRALLDNCRAVTDKIQVEYLSPALNAQRVGDLAEKYKFREQGLLVEAGSGDATETHYIRRIDLAEASAPGRERTSSFNGEIALMSVINHLVSEGQTKPVLYFTQGNGELDIFDSRTEDGAGRLRERLESRGFYQVKALQLAPESKEKPDLTSNRVVSERVPEDATAVVVLGPSRRFSEHALKALRDYAGLDETKETKDGKRKGRLMLFLQPLIDRSEDRFVQTGLEQLAAEFNVQVGNDLILHNPLAYEPRRDLEFIQVTPPAGNPMGEQNPVVKAFANRFLTFISPRTVRPSPGGRPGARNYSAEVLLEAPPEQGIWAETDIARLLNVRQIAALIKSGEVNKIASRTPLPVAVAVSEDDSPVPRDEFHAQVRRRGQQPRLVVMGNAAFFTNLSRGNAPDMPYDLFNSCLAWLRGRNLDIGIDPRRSDVYEWDPKANEARMTYLPGIVAAVVIISLGAGVWIVRRR